MTQVSPTLIFKHINNSTLLQHAYKYLEENEEVQELLKLSNIFAVSRLKYNDHGPVHAKIVAGTALELFDKLVNRGVEPTTLRDRTCENLDEAKLVILLASYLHDIGNAVHRDRHELIGMLLAKDILDKLLPKILHNKRSMYSIRQEVLHAIYATEYNVQCLTVEAGVVKIADGLDMSEGRARIPYKLGKTDIHAVSALSIKRVEIDYGNERPVKIMIYMEDMAGIFQVEKVLMPKIATSGLEDYIEVYVYSRGREIQTYPEKQLRQV